MKELGLKHTHITACLPPQLFSPPPSPSLSRTPWTSSSLSVPSFSDAEDKAITRVNEPLANVQNKRTGGLAREQIGMNVRRFFVLFRFC